HMNKRVPRPCQPAMRIFLRIFLEVPPTAKKPRRPHFWGCPAGPVQSLGGVLESSDRFRRTADSADEDAPCKRPGDEQGGGHDRAYGIDRDRADEPPERVGKQIFGAGGRPLESKYISHPQRESGAD